MKSTIYVLLALTLGFIVVNVAYADDYVKYQRYQDFTNSSTPEKIKRGQAIYQQNCVRCHGADGMRSPRRDVKPIAYMHPAKIFDELVDYKTEDDLFDWEEKAMLDVTEKLSYGDLEAVAFYIGTLRR